MLLLSRSRVYYYLYEFASSPVEFRNIDREGEGERERERERVRGRKRERERERKREEEHDGSLVSYVLHGSDL